MCCFFFHTTSTSCRTLAETVANSHLHWFAYEVIHKNQPLNANNRFEISRRRNNQIAIFSDPLEYEKMWLIVITHHSG